MVLSFHKKHEIQKRENQFPIGAYPNLQSLNRLHKVKKKRPTTQDQVKQYIANKWFRWKKDEMVIFLLSFHKISFFMFRGKKKKKNDIKTDKSHYMMGYDKKSSKKKMLARVKWLWLRSPHHLLVYFTNQKSSSNTFHLFWLFSLAWIQICTTHFEQTFWNCTYRTLLIMHRSD